MITWKIEIKDKGGNIERKLNGEGSIEELFKVVKELKNKLKETKGRISTRPKREVVCIRFPIEFDKKIKELGYRRSDFVIYCLEKFLENPDFLPIKKYTKTKTAHVTIPEKITQKILELKTPTTNTNLPYSQVIIRSIERQLSNSSGPPK
jgi:hypothetical protein